MSDPSAPEPTDSPSDTGWPAGTELVERMRSRDRRARRIQNVVVGFCLCVVVNCIYMAAEIGYDRTGDWFWIGLILLVMTVCAICYIVIPSDDKTTSP